MIATRLAWAGVSATSVATQAMVVLRALPGALASPQSSGAAARPAAPRPPNSPSISKGAAQNVRPPGAVTEPQQFTATSAPTAIPSAATTEAEPVPPFSDPAMAPQPAPAVPSSKVSDAAATAAMPSAR